MSCPVTIQTINGNECIGDSLPKIVGNFQQLEDAACDLYTKVDSLSSSKANNLSVVNSPTIDLSYNSTTGVLSADTTSFIATSSSAMVAKAWVVFAQAPSNSSFSVLNSYNATAITAGVGIFKITLTSGPGNTNYVCVHSCAFGTTSQAITTYEDFRIFNNFDSGTEVPRTATSVYLSTTSNVDGRSSSPFISVIFYW